MPFGRIFNSSSIKNASVKSLEGLNAQLYVVLQDDDGDEIMYKDGTIRVMDAALRAEVQAEINANIELIAQLS
jgi:hypothetical protein